MTAGPVLVDDVVVQQGEIVGQLHGDGRPHGVPGITPERPGGGQHERRPDRLARTAVGRASVGVLPAEVVHGDAPDGSGQRGDRRPQMGVD